jgi:hypothetical protein
MVCTVTTTATDDNQAAHDAADELGLQVFDFLGIDLDMLPADTTELRNAATACLFSSRKLNTRSRLVTAGRALALSVIAYADSPGPVSYRDLCRWSRKFEQLRLR